MKILVTGAAGFLGPSIVGRLLAHGQTDIRCLVRDPRKSSRLQSLRERYPEVNLDIVSGNLRYPKDAESAVEGVQLVIHAAAAMRGSAAEIFLDSVIASRNLLDAIVNHCSIRVILISSFGALGIAALDRGALIDEKAPLEPHPEWRDLYSHSKLTQERLFWNLSLKPCRYICLWHFSSLGWKKSAPPHPRRELRRSHRPGSDTRRLGGRGLSHCG
jgi:nucleoside-diphosphate-sugar epimerase